MSCDVFHDPIGAIIVTAASYAIPAMSWFFSSRRRFFIRTFVRPEDLRLVVRSLPREPNFKTGVRAIAKIQFAFAAIITLIVLWCNL